MKVQIFSVGGEKLRIFREAVGIRKGLIKALLIGMAAGLLGAAGNGRQEEGAVKKAERSESVRQEQFGEEINARQEKSYEQGKIAFLATKDDEAGEIYIMNSDGSGVVRLTNNPAMDAPSCWSGDGKKIVFVSSRAGERKTETIRRGITVIERVMIGNNGVLSARVYDVIGCGWYHFRFQQQTC